MKHPLVGKRDSDDRAKELFAAIRKNVENGMSDEQIEQLKTLGEKFHESFDVTSGNTKNIGDINMEEALAYVVESLKSGMHPSFLDENEKAILVAGYGENWFEKWGYSKEDL